MTQTFTYPVTTQVRAAMTVGYRDSRNGLRVYSYALQSVAECREEFGPTPEDARSFVGTTTCIECGIAGCELRECFRCDARGCACLVTSDDHSDHDVCADCAQPCYAGCCADD